MDENNKAFSISYSGATKDELERYKKKYSPNEATKNIKKIRSLDKTVDFIATMISIFLGLIGTAMLVAGIILCIKNSVFLIAGISLAVLGLIVDALGPFLFSKIHAMVKKHYAPVILELIKEIEQNQP